MIRKLTYAALAVLLCAAPLRASQISLNKSQLLDAVVFFSDQLNPINGLILEATDEGAGVEYEASLKADVDATLATIGIGLDDPASYGLDDLTGVDKFTLELKNVNDDLWSVNLALVTEDAFAVQTLHELPTFTDLLPGDDVMLVLDLVGIPDLDNVVAIGFQVQGLMGGPPGNPSNGDFTHVQAIPVPEPASTVFALAASVIAVFGLTRPRRNDT